MKYEIWPTKIHYEKGNKELVDLMFQSNVTTKHENKWFKDTDQFTEKLYEKIISAVKSTWKENLHEGCEIFLNGNMLYIDQGQNASWHWHHWSNWLSGIFYLQTGVGGEFILHPPTPVTNVNKPWFNPYEIHPEAGDLLIFPSYLGHEVLIHKGPGTRLCLPFDLYLKPDGFEAYVDHYIKLD